MVEKFGVCFAGSDAKTVVSDMIKAKRKLHESSERGIIYIYIYIPVHEGAFG